MVALIERELLSIMGIITNPKIFKVRITMDAFRVYSCICNFIENGFEDDDLPKYHCRASYKRIIEKCFRDTYPEASESHLKNKAIDAVNELCDLQVIEKILIKDVNGSHKENVYRLRPDSDWCVDANPTKERYRFNVHGRNSRSLTPVSSNQDSNTTKSTEESIMQSKPSKLIIKGYDDIEDVPDVFVFSEDIPSPPVFDYTGLDEDSDEYLEILQQEVEYNQRRFKAYAKWAKAYQKAKDARENKNRIEKSPLNPRNFIPNIDELYANAPSELDQQIDEKIFEKGSLPSKPGVVYGINQVDEKINTGSKSEEKNSGNVDNSKVSDINNVYSQNLTIPLENGCNAYIESNTVNGNKNDSNSVCYNSSSLNSININKISNKEEDYYRKVEILSSPDKKKYYFDLECQELLIEIYTRHKPKNWFSIEKGIPAYQKRQLNEILREENFNGNAGELLQRLESGLKYAKQDEYWNDNQGGLHSLLYHSNFEIWAGMYDHEQSKAVVSQIDTAKTMNISDLDRDVYKFDYPEFINQIKKGKPMNQEQELEDEERHLTPEELAQMNERKKAKEWVRSLRINTLAVIHQREQEQIELERSKKYNPELEYEKTRETEKINPMYSKKFTGTKIENGMFTEEYVNFLENSQYIKDDEDDEENYDDF